MPKGQLKNLPPLVISTHRCLSRLYMELQDWANLFVARPPFVENSRDGGMQHGPPCHTPSYIRFPLWPWSGSSPGLSPDISPQVWEKPCSALVALFTATSCLLRVCLSGDVHAGWLLWVVVEIVELVRRDQTRWAGTILDTRDRSTPKTMWPLQGTGCALAPGPGLGLSRGRRERKDWTGSETVQSAHLSIPERNTTRLASWKCMNSPHLCTKEKIWS